MSWIVSLFHLTSSHLPFCDQSKQKWLGSFQLKDSNCNDCLSSWKQQNLSAAKEPRALRCSSGRVPSKNTGKGGKEGEMGWGQDLRCWSAHEVCVNRLGRAWISEVFTDTAEPFASSLCLFTPPSRLSHSLIHTIPSMETTYTHAP